MQYAGGKHIDVPRRGGVAGQTRLHDAASFFYEHQLHAVLPVQGHLGKILRDGAGIDVEREPRCAVLFGFPQSWLIFHVFALHDRIVPQVAGITQESAPENVVYFKHSKQTQSQTQTTWRDTL